MKPDLSALANQGVDQRMIDEVIGYRSERSATDIHASSAKPIGAFGRFPALSSWQVAEPWFPLCIWSIHLRTLAASPDRSPTRRPVHVRRRQRAGRMP